MRSKPALAASFLLSSLVASMLTAAPAAAAPVCSGWWGFNETTIGAGGQPLATTPEVHVEVCVTAPEASVNSLPDVEVKQDYPHGYYGIFLRTPESDGSDGEVSVTYSVAQDGDTRTVTAPVAGGDDDRICVFFWGPQFWYPGDCLVFLIN